MRALDIAKTYLGERYSNNKMLEIIERFDPRFLLSEDFAERNEGVLKGKIRNFMKDRTSKVILISHTVPVDTQNCLDTVYAAAAQCYSKDFSVSDLDFIDNGKKAELIQKVISSGHTSVLEHISFTFQIQNVSRVLTHQLVRHRIASYTQQSQRYVSDDFGYIVPPSIQNNPEAIDCFCDVMENIQKSYEKLLEMGIPKEDARFVLSNATKTRLVMTMNCRELSNFFAVRLCSRAQWEIREVAKEMSKICKRILPEVFEEGKIGFPACVQRGSCPEDVPCGFFKQAKLTK